MVIVNSEQAKRLILERKMMMKMTMMMMMFYMGVELGLTCLQGIS